MEKKNNPRNRTIVVLSGILGLVIVFLFVRSCGLEKENEELRILNQMLQDQKELVCIYESGDMSSEEWLIKYREIGNRFLNYLCEYGGEKEEVKALMEQYQRYGEKILSIADRIQEGKWEEAKKELEEVKALAEEVETSLEAAYESVR